jgi:hypothetical protein
LGGLDFDYNTVTYTKVIALQKQVSEKIKAIEESNRKKKSDGKRNNYQKRHYRGSSIDHWYRICQNMQPLKRISS